MLLCVSDAHQGLKNTIGKVLGVPWQSCTVHFLGDMLGHVQRSQQQMVGAAIRQVFAARTREEVRAILADVVTRLEPVAPKVARLEDAESDLLAFLDYSAEHRSKLRSTNPLERVNREIGRRSDLIGILFPNDADPIRLSAALFVEQKNKWLVMKRYISVESIASLRRRTPGETDRRHHQHDERAQGGRPLPGLSRHPHPTIRSTPQHGT
ncbi:MAG TPA: transposase [Microbacteriaceae bacterium]|nr:transposase [Microbacteriaceae bacterium]